MSLLLVTALLSADPAIAQNQQPGAPAPAAVQKVKKEQICEMMEVTGSRSKKRVCRDADGNMDLGPGVHGGSIGGAKIGDQSAPGN